MPATKARVKRRHKHCPVCEEEVAMSVIREAENDDDLWWLLCPTCDSKFALTSKEYRTKKNSDISAIEEDSAKTYSTNRTYLVGELIYHPKLDDMGLVLDKSPFPSDDCSGAITVSFMELGHKTLIEGYSKA